MTERSLFVIRNQLEQYLDKQNGWQSGKDNNALYKTEHRDEALNTLIEINAKDISLRGQILEVPADEKKRPVVEVSEAALALDKAAAQDNPQLFDDDENTPDENAEEVEETVLLIEEVDISFSENDEPVG